MSENTENRINPFLTAWKNYWQNIAIGLFFLVIYSISIYIFSESQDSFNIKIANAIINDQLFKEDISSSEKSLFGAKYLLITSICFGVVVFIFWSVSFIRKKHFRLKIEEIIESGKSGIEVIKNHTSGLLVNLKDNGVENIDRISKDGFTRINESFSQGKDSLEFIKKSSSDSLLSITENGITNINESFNQGKISLEYIKNSIKDELENTASLISAKIDENLYSYSLLKKDMLNSQMIFIYGNFIYLKKPQSNDFLKTALVNKYWIIDSARYFIIITQRNKETITNIFEFLKKIKSGIDNYFPSQNDFNNFFVGFQNHNLELPSPVQLVAFVFNNKDYTIKKGLKIKEIEKISFSGHQSLPIQKNENNAIETIKLTAAIDQTLIFSNDLITHNTNIEKQIIGFRIPINTDADKDYEVLKEFDRLKSEVTYIKLKDIINCCLSCNNIDSCFDDFLNCINKNNFNCENKNT